MGPECLLGSCWVYQECKTMAFPHLGCFLVFAFSVRDEDYKQARLPVVIKNSEVLKFSIPQS